MGLRFTIQTVLATTVVAMVDFLCGGNYLNMAIITAVRRRFLNSALTRTILLEQILGMERLLLLFYLKRVLMHPSIVNPVR